MLRGLVFAAILLVSLWAWAVVAVLTFHAAAGVAHLMWADFGGLLWVALVIVGLQSLAAAVVVVLLVGGEQSLRS